MNIIVALRVTLGMSVLAGAAVSGNAMAQTCDSSSGSVPPVNTYSDPSEYYCNYPYYWLTEGPGVAFVAQDESNSTVAGTVGLMGTSLYNTGVYGLSFFGDGNGVIGLSGTGTVPSGAAGVMGVGDNVAGVYGYTTTANQGVAGVNTNTSTTNTSSHGVEGQTSARASAGVFGLNNAAGIGVQGISSGGTAGNGAYGVYGSAGSSGFGIYGDGAAGTAVFGDNRTQTTGGHAAVNAQTGDGTGYGGFFVNNGSGGSDYAGYFSSTYGTGLYATGDLVGVTGSSTVLGVQGTTTTGTGVEATATSSGGVGLYASCTGSGCYAAEFAEQIKVVSMTYSSDIRLKKNVAPLTTRAIDQLLKLKGVTFDWKEPEKHGGHPETQIGFIAQEVEKYFPEWVSTDRDGFKTLDVHQIEALEVESIRALRDRAEKADARADKAERELKAVKADTEDRLDRLEGLTNLPRAGFGYGYGGWAGAGLAGVALGIVMAGRKKNEKKS